jgi:branched-chain amino acid transport system permease protein
MKARAFISPSVTGRTGRQVTVAVANRRHLVALGIGIVVLVVLAFFPVFGGTAWTRRLIDFLLLVAMAQMWNLLLGFGGIISVGQQGYIGVGCYSVWLFADVLHVPLFLSVIFAAVVGGLLAIPSAAVVFKLRMGYLAIGTMVLAEMYRMIVGNIEATGGGSGVTIQAATGISNETRIAGTFWWALAAAAIAIGAVYFILRSRTGVALKAVRDDDLAAESLGVNLWRTRLYVFVIAGAGCALAGGILALNLLRIQPASAFAINWSAYLVFMSVVGGLGTIEGPIIGAVIFFVLRETTSQYGGWYFIVLGLVAVIVPLWNLGGIYGYIARKTRFFLFPVQRRATWKTAPTPAVAESSPIEEAAG